jgi:hypothetical protein
MQMTAGETAAADRAFEASQRICADAGISIPLLDVYCQMGLAMSAVLAGDFQRSEAHRVRADSHWKTFRRVDIAASALIKGVLASHRGDFEAAREFAREHLEVSKLAGIQWQSHNAMLHCAFVAHELGRHAEGLDFTRQARELAASTVYERFRYQSDLLDAYGCYKAGDREGLHARLASGFHGGRGDTAKFFLRLHPNLLPRVCAEALVRRHRGRQRSAAPSASFASRRRRARSRPGRGRCRCARSAASRCCATGCRSSSRARRRARPCSC